MDPPQLRGTHAPTPQRPGSPPPPQVCPDAQVPHARVPPQPSGAAPQRTPRDSQVRGVHTTPPSEGATGAHTLGRPPTPQASPVEQLPQSSRPPQPSATGPQLAPAAWHVRGTQPDEPPQRLG
jgi:hypothetical protein